MNGKEQQQQPETFDLSKSSVMVCEKCGNSTFSVHYVLRRISPLLTNTGHPEIASLPVFACSKCGWVNEGLGRELLKG